MTPGDMEALVGRLRAYADALKFARSMSLKPTEANQVETVQVTARESEIIASGLTEAGRLIESLLAERSALAARLLAAERVVEQVSAWFESATQKGDKGCDWLNEGGWEEAPEVAALAASWLADGKGEGSPPPAIGR